MLRSSHYENLRMQYTETFFNVKIENIVKKNVGEAVLTSIYNLCYGVKTRKKMVHPWACIPIFCYMKVGYEGENISRTFFSDVMA